MRNRPQAAQETTNEGTFEPQLDVRRTNEALIVAADLPGVDERDLEVSLDFDRLVVHGRRPREEPGEIIYGRAAPWGSFVRSLALPPECRADESWADLSHGVLTITVPLEHGAADRG